MKNIYAIFLGICVLLSMHVQAQVIPDSLRVDWSQAGYNGEIPEPSLIINVKDFGAYGDSIHDDYTAITNAINSSAAFRVIYFPPGNYLIKSPLFLFDSTVLRGEGTATQLVFDLSQIPVETNCITVSSIQLASYKTVNAGYYKGSNSVTLSNLGTNGFSVNGYAEIKENNGGWGSSNYSDVGQIVKISSISGNTLQFSSALRINYSSALQPKITPVTMITSSGIECLKITRLDPPFAEFSGQNISFSYAANCWVIGVESNQCQTAHLSLTSCAHITVSGCFFHDAFTYDGGGQAYGAQCRRHTSDCKIENSIFCRLRHAMIQQSGANGNVYGYNYSFDPRSTTEMPKDKIGDISLHGDYAYANLFEGNIGQNIFVDDYWGASGPYNTFFRNRAELYGLEILDDYNYAVKSDRQNIAGNEITNTEAGKGNYVLKGSNHFTYSNNVQGTIQPAGTNVLNDSSYYLHEKPAFWNDAAAWPSIGYPNLLNSGTNPAKQRWLSNEEKVVCLTPPASKVQISIAADSINCYSDSTKIIISASGGNEPYTGTGIFYEPAGSYTFVVADASGKTDSEKIIINEPAPINFSYSASNATACDSISGSITFESVTGGTTPFLYSINAIDYTNTPVFNNLSANAYNLWIKDSLGCMDSMAGVTIMQTPKISALFSTIAAQTCKPVGAVTVNNITGGISPYMFSLNDGSYYSDSVFYNLSGGNYIIKIQDSSGCIDTINIVVESVPSIIISAKTTRTSSCNNDGIISIKASGGQAPFQYKLNNGIYARANVFTNLSPGTYTVWVKDRTNCTDSLSNITITRVDALLSSSRKTNISCKNKNDATITVIGKGGVAPYLYSLDSVNFSPNNKFINLSAGTYKAWVKDIKACTAFSTTVIKNSNATCSQAFTNENIYWSDAAFKISVLPNPSAKDFTVVVETKSKEKIQLIVKDILGRAVYTEGSEKTIYNFGEHFAAGIYVIEIEQGSISKKLKIIKQ